MAAAYRAPACLSCASPMASCSHASSPTTTLPLLSHPRTHYSPQYVLPPAFTHLSVSHPCFSVSPAKERSGRDLRKVMVFCGKYFGGNGASAIVTAASWKVSVLNSELPVLVEFFTTWCGPCRMVGRVIDEIAEEYSGRVRCFKLNADYYPQLVNDYGIEHVPTVLLFKNGKKLESITGTMPKYVYVGAIERSLAS